MGSNKVFVCGVFYYLVVLLLLLVKALFVTISSHSVDIIKIGFCLTMIMATLRLNLRNCSGLM